MPPTTSVDFDKVARVLSQQKFFIAGTERSGTTWLQIMLNGHPDIACRGEGHFVDHLIPKMDELFDDYRATIGAFNKSYFKDTDGFPTPTDAHQAFIKRISIAMFMADFDPDRVQPVYGEKTPGNVRQLDTLIELFPNARFVFIIRDGRDVAVSLWHHGRRKGAPNRPPLGEFTKGLAASWRNDIKLLTAFRDRYPNRTHIVRYEDLHTTPEKSLVRLFDFLGVTATDNMVGAAIKAGDFKRFSGGRSRGEEDNSAQFRKGIVGDWQNYEDAGIDQIFRDIANEEMTRMRYFGDPS